MCYLFLLKGISIPQKSSQSDPLLLYFTFCPILSMATVSLFCWGRNSSRSLSPCQQPSSLGPGKKVGCCQQSASVKWPSSLTARPSVGQLCLHFPLCWGLHCFPSRFTKVSQITLSLSAYTQTHSPAVEQGERRVPATWGSGHSPYARFSFILKKKSIQPFRVQKLNNKADEKHSPSVRLRLNFHQVAPKWLKKHGDGQRCTDRQPGIVSRAL